MIYHFDPTGALTSLIDDYGNTQMWTYDGTGRLQRVQDSVSGRYLDLYYGGDGRLSTIQDSTGRQVQYGYDGNGDLTTVTDPLNRVTTYSYVQGRFVPLLARIQDAWGRVITDITYDSTDRVLSYTEDGERFTYTYSYSGNANQTAKNYDLNSGGSPWVYSTGTFGQITNAATPAGSGGAAKSTVPTTATEISSRRPTRSA